MNKPTITFKIRKHPGFPRQYNIVLFEARVTKYEDYFLIHLELASLVLNVLWTQNN